MPTEYKSDPVWYSLLCLPVYLAAVPVFLLLLVIVPFAAIVCGPEWVYRRIDGLDRLLP